MPQCKNDNTKTYTGTEPGEKVLTFSSARLEKTQRVSSNEPYQATVDKRGSLAMPKNKPYDVYRNKAFEKEIKSITKLNFNFSEQGLQKIHKAHMELDNISIIKLIKKYQ